MNDERRLHWRMLDLCDRASTGRLLAEVKPDFVFHLAGLANAGRDATLVLPTLDSNLMSTVNILCSALDVGSPRIVLPGSLEEPTDPQAVASSPYAMSKWAASGYGRMFAESHGSQVSVARIFLTYGPTSRDLHKLVPYVLLSLLDDRSPELASGDRKVDWIYVDDVVDGLIAIASSPRTVGQTLDLGSGMALTVRSFVERLAALVGSSAAPKFGARSDRRMETVQVADVQRTYEACGWRPRISLGEGLERTVEWFRRNRGALHPAYSGVRSSRR